MILVSKRLKPGVFKWPPIMDGVMRLSAGQLVALIDGLDWTHGMCHGCCDRTQRESRPSCLSTLQSDRELSTPRVL
jgi:transposase